MTIICHFACKITTFPRNNPMFLLLWELSRYFDYISHLNKSKTSPQDSKSYEFFTRNSFSISMVSYTATVLQQRRKHQLTPRRFLPPSHSIASTSALLTVSAGFGEAMGKELESALLHRPRNTYDQVLRTH